MRKMKIGDWVFDDIEYDVDADVLYMSIGEPRKAVGEQTPEGHIVHFDEKTDEFCGVTLIGVQRILSETGTVNVTVPAPPQPLSKHALDRVLSAC